MRIALLAVGTKPPEWVRAGFEEYRKRLPKPYAPELIELAAGARGTGRDPKRAIQDEGARVLAAVPRGARLVLLDERGSSWSSAQLSQQLGAWSQDGRDVALAIGGADGHAPEVSAKADQRWSLGPLTLPHMLVRLILIEQLYRAWTLMTGHPYHRA
jgi:23S rRNA (pseudouridine1915-N3)-methyltransferase